MPQVSVLVVKYNLELITLPQFYLKIVEGAQRWIRGELRL